jgi:hypothetical protein
LPVPHYSSHAPFPHPAHRTGQAQLTHPAPGGNITVSLRMSVRAAPRAILTARAVTCCPTEQDTIPNRTTAERIIASVENSPIKPAKSFLWDNEVSMILDIVRASRSADPDQSTERYSELPAQRIRVIELGSYDERSCAGTQHKPKSFRSKLKLYKRSDLMP